jgi:branched-chain amino acid transport system substrate-binding protein
MVKENPSGAKFVAYRNSYWKEDVNTSLARDFRSAYSKKFQGKPNAWVAISFDAAWVLFHAMNRAKDSNSPEQIREELSRLKNIQVVTAPRFRFGSNNSPDKELYLYRIDSQGIHYEATLP